MIYFILYIISTSGQITDVVFDQGFAYNTKSQTQINSTDIFRITNLSKKYYYVNITLKMNDIDFFLFSSLEQPATIQNYSNSKNVSVDLNGQIENRLTRFLKLESQGQTIYITASGGRQQNYEITVRGSDREICSNDCSSHGQCSKSGCKCQAQYIGDDCHQGAQTIQRDGEIEIYLKSSNVYFTYLQLQESDYSNEELSFYFKTTSEYGIYIFFETTDILYIPQEDQYNQYVNQLVKIVYVSSGSPLSVSIELRDTEQQVFVVAAQQMFAYDDSTLKISIGYNNSSGSTSSTAIIIIVLTISVAIIIIIVTICICRRLRRARYLQQLSLQRMRNSRQQPQQAEIVKKESEQVIERLMIVTDTSAFQEENCAICLDSLNNSSIVRQTPCHHNFHATCLLLWLEKTQECPNCRTSLKLKDFKESGKHVI